jgi:hypothetical protein
VELYACLSFQELYTTNLQNKVNATSAVYPSENSLKNSDMLWVKAVLSQ